MNKVIVRVQAYSVLEQFRGWLREQLTSPPHSRMFSQNTAYHSRVMALVPYVFEMLPHRLRDNFGTWETLEGNLSAVGLHPARRAHRIGQTSSGLEKD